MKIESQQSTIIQLSLELKVAREHLGELETAHQILQTRLDTENKKNVGLVKIKNKQLKELEWRLEQTNQLHQLGLVHAHEKVSRAAELAGQQTGPTTLTIIPSVSSVRSRANVPITSSNLRNWARELQTLFVFFCQERNFTQDQVAELKKYVQFTLFGASEGDTLPKTGQAKRATRAECTELKEWLKIQSPTVIGQCALVSEWLRPVSSDLQIQVSRDAGFYLIIVRSVVEQITSGWDVDTSLKIKFKMRLSRVKLAVLNQLLVGKIDEEGTWEPRSIEGVQLTGLAGHHKRSVREKEILEKLGYKATKVAYGAAVASIRKLVEQEIQICDALEKIPDGKVIDHLWQMDKAQFHKGMGVVAGGVKLPNLSPDANAPLASLNVFCMEKTEKYQDVSLQLDSVINEFNGLNDAVISIEPGRACKLCNCMGGDIPSVSGVLGLGGSSCSFPCNCCMVPLDQLSSLNPPPGGWRMRTLADSDLLAHSVEGFCRGCNKQITKALIVKFSEGRPKNKNYLKTHFGQYEGQPPLIRVEYNRIVFCRLHAKLRSVAAIANTSIWPYVDQIAPTDGKPESKQSAQLFDLFTRYGMRVKKRQFKKSAVRADKFDLQRSLMKHSYNGSDCDTLLALWPLILEILHPPGSGAYHAEKRTISGRDWISYSTLETAMRVEEGSLFDHAEGVRKSAQFWMECHQVILT